MNPREKIQSILDNELEELTELQCMEDVFGEDLKSIYSHINWDSAKKRIRIQLLNEILNKCFKEEIEEWIEE